MVDELDELDEPVDGGVVEEGEVGAGVLAGGEVGPALDGGAVLDALVLVEAGGLVRSGAGGASSGMSYSLTPAGGAIGRIASAR